MKRALMLVFIVGFTAPAAAQERLADQLRKGIVQEEASQNLEKAIKAYEAIVAQFDEDRKAAATALFRLAECYRKAGKRDQAVAAYQRVVREFADQTALVEPSRRQLASTYGVSESRLARSAGRAATREATGPTSSASDLYALETQMALKAAERELAAVQDRIADYEGQIRNLNASRESAEFRQLQRDWEAARDRLEVARAKMRGIQAERPGTTGERRDVTPEMLRSTQIEMDALQKRLAQMKQRVEVGIAHPQEYQELQTQFEILALRYQELLKAREASEATAREAFALNQRLIQSLETEIALLTRWIDAAEKGVIKNYAPDSPELLQLRRELLALQRKLDELRASVKR